MPLNRDRASAAQPPILKSFDSVTDAPRKAIVGLKGELPDALLVSPNHSKQGDGLGGKRRIASLGFQLPHLLPTASPANSPAAWTRSLVVTFTFLQMIELLRRPWQRLA